MIFPRVFVPPSDEHKDGMTSQAMSSKFAFASTVFIDFIDDKVRLQGGIEIPAMFPWLDYWSGRY
jgi:hypothetical protein